MNVITAAYQYGKALNDRKACSCEYLSQESIKDMLGEETAFRFFDLYNHESKKYSFRGCSHALSKLERLRDPESENDPIQYWTSLRDVLSGNEKLREYSRKLIDVEKLVSDVIGDAFGLKGADDAAAAFPTKVFCQRDELIACIKRTGVLAYFKQMLAAQGTVDSKEIDEYVSKRGRKIDTDIFSMFMPVESEEIAGINEELRLVLDRLFFLESLVMMAAFWGYAGQSFSVDVEHCEHGIEQGSLIRRIEICTDDSSLLINHLFAAIEVRQEQLVVGYILPERKTFDFIKSEMRNTIEGLYYPVSDKGLLSRDEIFERIAVSAER